ncbi:MAG TPA: ATP-dependent sacrificial sulfur transferase LarE [Candidatus Omnitrophota bacterium]|nr:ATP-dependent sacrificial sulfur transferase LarE [Candidatus Omnitrophota bacterium]
MSPSSLEEKFKALKLRLESLGSVLVAYSGGVDSSLLLKIASLVLDKKVLAITALSETYPLKETRSAKELAKKMKVRHEIIRTKEFSDKDFRRNFPDRRYHCKKELFSSLLKIARRKNIKYVIDGSNADDLKDYRPGSRAKKELKIISPLQETGFTKKDVRLLSKRLGLGNWQKPALACLASRIPFNTPITKQKLSRIDRAETLIRGKFNIKGNLRVRDHGDLARVELDRPEIRKVDPLKMDRILKNLGYKSSEIDPKGYIMGSLSVRVF